MPLTLKLRGKIWHIEGRIDEIPNSIYHRRSTRRPEKKDAQAFLDWFKRSEIKVHFGETKRPFIFAEAVAKYKQVTPENAEFLLRVMPHLEHVVVSKITPSMVKDLGPIIRPNNSTDTWHRQIIVPVRAVINNAHQYGLCPPIQIKTYTKDERQRQDRKRGKLSRVPKEAADWEWILKFKAAAEPRLGLLAEFMYVTGARVGQAVLLRPTDMDYKNSRFFIPEAKGAPAQWVEIPQNLAEELAQLLSRQPKGCDDNGKPYEERVFGYAKADGFRRKWKAICEKADIKVIMPHAAGRYGFATELYVRQGIDLRTVASAGRWADPSLILNIYARPENTAKKILDAFRTGRAQAKNNSNRKPLKDNGDGCVDE